MTTDDKVEAAIELARQRAKRWLRDESPDESGHVTKRNLVVRETLSPATDESYAEVTAATGRLEPFETDPFSMFGWERGKPLDYDDDKGQVLVEKAIAGNTDADAALCNVACILIAAGRKLPRHLAGYIAAILGLRFEEPPKRRRGGDPYARVRRNLVILGCVVEVWQLGFRPTRNRASRDDAQESACSIVATALAKMGIDLDETGVEKVWANRDQIWS